MKAVDPESTDERAELSREVPDASEPSSGECRYGERAVARECRAERAEREVPVVSEP